MFFEYSKSIVWLYFREAFSLVTKKVRNSVGDLGICYAVCEELVTC